MKKLIVPLLTLLFAFAPAGARAQSAPPTFPTWAQSYGVGSYDGNGNHLTSPDAYGSGKDAAVSIAAMPDGGVAVAGYIDLPELYTGTQRGSEPCSALVRYAADGHILWQQLLRQEDDRKDNGTYPYVQVYQVVADAQGNLFLNTLRAGNTAVPNTEAYVGDYITHTATVAKFGPDGTLLWQAAYGGDAYFTPGVGSTTHPSFHHTSVSSLNPTGDGGVVVAGDEGAPLLFKINADGSLGFHRTFAPAGGGTQGAAGAAQSVDGKRFIAAMTNGTVVLMDASGSILAQRAYAGISDRILANPDGTYTMLTDPGAFGGTAIVRKLQPDLTTIWETSVHLRTSCHNLSRTADGGYIITTFDDGGLLTGSGPRTYDAIVLRLDANGKFARAFALGGPDAEGRFIGGDSRPYDVVAATETTDGGLALTVTSYSYHLPDSVRRPDWWTVKADATGHVPGFDGVMGSVPASFFDVHYNAPSDTAATIYGAPPSNNTGGVNYVMNDAPHFLPQDLGLKTGINKPTVTNQTTTPIPPPAHGGLSGITFSVDESETAATGSLADQVLRFRAVQSSRAAGVTVRVQSSTDGTTWTDLNDGNHGEMIYSVLQNAYVLNSTSYPIVNGVSFRVKIKGPAYGEKASSPVGRFDLASSKPHLAAPSLSLPIRDGTLADLYFRATETNAPSGTRLRVQSSTSPGEEGSWKDLADGTGGAMLPRNVAGKFYLLGNHLPATQNAYFRVIAAASGYIDGISKPWGSYTIVPDVPPKVSITITSGATTGTGTIDNPYLVPGGHFNLLVQAVPDGSRPASKVTKLKALINGATIDTSGNARLDVDYTQRQIGDYLLEAIAVDDLGGRARAGTGPVYIRIANATDTAAKSERAADSTALAAQTTGKVYRANGGGGLWNDPNLWTDAKGGHAVPGRDDHAVLGAASVLLTSDITVTSLSINGGEMIGQYNVNILGTMTLSAGRFTNNLNLIIHAGAVCQLTNSTDLVFSGTIQNDGILRVHGSGGIKGLRGFTNNGTSNFEIPFTLPPNPGYDVAADLRAIQANSILGTGSVMGANPDGLLAQLKGGVIAAGAISDNGAGVISNDGGSLISQDGGGIISEDGTGILSEGGAGLIADHGDGLISQDGGGLISQDGGGLTGNGFVTGNRAASSSSAKAEQDQLTSVAAAETSADGYTQNGGNTNLGAVSIIGPVTLNGGVLSGSGVIAGDLTNNGGYITPAQATPGVMAVTGNYTQGVNGALILSLGGADPSQFDQLQIGGAANLGGRVDVKLINGYTPNVADTSNPLGYSSATEAFSAVSSNAQVTVNATGVLTTVDPAKANPKSGQPVNIATRLAVESGDNVLIAGFFVTGPAGSSKKVIIRGLGPSLPLPPTVTMSDPLLEFHNADGSTVVNDNWQEGDTSAIPAGFSPSSDKESVIVATLTVGTAGYSGYTAILKGAHGEQGVGLVELYDLDTGGAAQLANIATRGRVQTGDNLLIGGFIVQGSEPAKMLVRATGPSSGIAGALADPVLEVHDSNGSTISNDNWRETQEGEIRATGLAPTDNREPAILATLVPGGYTAVVRGKDDTTGIAVVEAYNLQ